ncbi:Protein kinase superfamily protein [Raphanus sativus]|uniref:non-specific serine/threonine protein kinase n=1 Tax=Raphanus sativus TaxID=3726 RepID=A0A6J0K4S6_RAPSA|nr:serine/threonine-protein kinase PCRK2 [Raphanus sativus]KAJ4882345.1 Protein kinase superfamily protein [Raphanus sativus]
MYSKDLKVEKPSGCFHLFGRMKCFLFPHKRDDEHRSPKPLSPLSDRATGGFTNNGSNGSVASTVSSSTTGRNSNHPLPTRENNLREFTITDLKSSTKNFSRSVMIGEGGFGCVYWGTVKSLEDPSKKIEVAVKQLGKRGLQGHKEWVTEVNFLGVVEHPNLVKLLGHCAEDDERGIQRLLVYEYMPNQSVEFHLAPRSPTVLTWDLRLRIAQDAARGLTYLHEEMDFQIIFRDFKSSNILLDEDWKAKLSDFGLARLGPEPGSTHVSTGVVGTMGYAAPEYIQTGRLTSKSDVWGYGVFIYELITGRRPLDKNRPKGEQKLLEWVRPYLTDTKKFRLIIDPRLEGKYLIKPVQRLAVVANLCLARNPKARPKMSEVLEMVTKIVEASSPRSGGGKKQQLLPLRSLEASRDEEEKNKKVVDGGEGGWLDKLWNPKNVRAC